MKIRKSGTPYPITGVPSQTAGGGSEIEVFDTEEATAFNRARLEHLRSLNLQIEGKTVLDVGAGVGHLTRFFLESGCKVLCVDGREGNIHNLKARYPDVQAHVANVETDPLSRFGRFDIVLCYGLLYHLENPVAALRNMASVCMGLLLLETVIVDRAEPVLRLVDEPQETPNQALSGVGSRPSPSFVAMALTRAGLPFVYAPTSPPEHPDFRFQWKNDLEYSRKSTLLRCVFVASRTRLDNPALELLLAGPQRTPASFFPPAANFEQPKRVWIDVGAHLGEKTFRHAEEDPALRVYAFEPNLAVASKRMGLLPNFIVIPMAVAEADGSADFYINAYDAASSLLPLDLEGLSQWIGGDQLQVGKQITVPTVRLDTFLASAGIDEVEYLKIDAQGADLAVVKSAGSRLNDVRQVSLEVQVAPAALYRGASKREDVLEYMQRAGFELVSTERQSNDQEENLNFVLKTGASASGGLVRAPALFSPAGAYWNQRNALARSRERILNLHGAVGAPSDLWPYQWAQLIASVLEFKPDLILELGRGSGNSTCAFTEAANLLGVRECRVLSVCPSDNWDTRTAPRLRGIVPESWFSPLQAVRAKIHRFDFLDALSGARKVLIYWKAQGFDIAERILGNLLPRCLDREHLVILHGISDLRHNAAGARSYGGDRLWRGEAGRGTRLMIGYMDSAPEHLISILDFVTRNRLSLHSADHSNHLELGADLGKMAEMRTMLGKELFDLQGHWFYFSLNEHPGPYTFPESSPPRFNFASRTPKP